MLFSYQDLLRIHYDLIIAKVRIGCSNIEKIDVFYIGNLFRRQVLYGKIFLNCYLKLQ